MERERDTDVDRGIEKQIERERANGEERELDGRSKSYGDPESWREG